MNAGKCTACRGQCCYGALARLSWDDVRRIQRAQRLAFTSFARIVPDEDRIAKDFALAFVLGARSSPHLLALRHSSRVACACTFLVLVAGQPCGIYADRPAVCRVYPMQLDEATIAVRDDVTCRPAYWDLTRLEPAPYLDAIRLQHCEWRIFERTVAVWNRTFAGSDAAMAEAFTAYLDRAYARIDRARAVAAPGEYDALVRSWLDDEPPHAPRRAAFLNTVEDLAWYALGAGDESTQR